MRGLAKKYFSSAKALPAVLACCVFLCAFFAPIRAAFEYKPIVADVPFTCVKADVEGGGSYEFVIEGIDASTPKANQDTVKVDGSGSGNFGIVIDEPGTYQYKLYEKTGDNENIVYDSTVYLVTLFVTNDDAGNLQYQVILAKEGMVQPTEVKFINTASRKADPTPTPTPKREQIVVKTGDFGNTFSGKAWVLLAAGACLLLLALGGKISFSEEGPSSEGKEAADEK